MVVVTLTYLAPLDEIDALMPRHVRWLKRQYKAGVFLASGRQVPRRGGVILARSGSIEALRAVLDKDPFIEAGAASYEVVEFVPSMTAAGAEVLKQL